MLNIIKGATGKQVLAEQLIEILEEMEIDGYIYIGYPVLGGLDGKIKVDALLISKQQGLVIFDLDMSNEGSVEDKEVLMDELYNNMEARLKRYNYLSQRRKLKY